MKTESHTSESDKVVETIVRAFDPSARQAKAFGALVAQLAPLPARGLTQYWIDKPRRLAARLKSLNYGPARISYPLGVQAISKAIDSLMSEALVQDAGNLGEMAYDPRVVDLVILNVSIPQDREMVEIAASKGVAVMAIAINEDENMFLSRNNIYTFSGNRFDPFEIECFIRDLLFRIRDRLYMGEVN